MANYTSTNTGANIDSAINQVIDSSTDLNVDSGTLVVDKSENKVGVGTAAPGQQLTVNNSTASSATQGVDSDYKPTMELLWHQVID